MIGTVVAVSLLGGLVAGARAGDEKPGGAKKDVHVYSEEEWLAKVRDIQNIDVVGVKRTDVLSREAAKSVIRMRVKIWDVRPTKDGPAVDLVDVVPSSAPADAPRLPRDPIVLPPSDGETVAAWKRWDRLTFKVTPKVAPDGSIAYAREVRGASDIDRLPNPGIEYPTSDVPLARADAFRDWVERFSRACAVPEWKTAWKSYSQAAATAFPVSATAREAPAGPLQRGPVSRVFDISDYTGTTGYGLLDAQGHPRTWANVEIADPQVAEALKGGVRAELHIHVLGFDKREDLELHEGRFRTHVTFGRIR
jgi:hypothetical protein